MEHTDAVMVAEEEVAPTDSSAPAWSDADREVAEELVAKAKDQGLDLIGPDGVLTGLTKRVLEAGLQAELTEHLGYDKHDPDGRDGGNSRNGTRTRTVLTDIGPISLDVPHGRDGTFEPSGREEPQ